MGTRCIIAKEQSDGSVRTVFCFLDGYPAAVGQVLLDHYREEASIDALLDLGCLSSVGASAKAPIPYRRLSKMSINRWKRGEDGARITKILEERCIIAAGAEAAMNHYDSSGMDEFRAKLAETDARFLYLWGEGGWTVSARPYDDLELLEDALARDARGRRT